jgi:hypothetical protein
MDPRIADFIREHRNTLTREAITQQLLEAGYTRESIDATWAVLDTPDPDDTAGEGFWRRWLLIVVGINLAVLLLVGVTTESLFADERRGLLLILAAALGVGGLISYGVVAAVGPSRVGRTTATVIGVTIPLLFALLIGGSCYALLASLGPVPRSGTLDLEVDGRPDMSGSGIATCHSGGPTDYSVFGQLDQAAFTTVDLSAFAPDGSAPDGSVQSLSIGTQAGAQPEQVIGYSNFTGSATLESEVRRDGLEGSVTFTDLQSDLAQEPVEGGGEPPAPISGTATWSCDE